MFHCSGENEGKTREFITFGLGGLFKVDAGGLQAFDELAVFQCLEKFDDAFSNDWTDIADFFQTLDVGGHQFSNVWKILRENTRRAAADVADAEREEDAVERAAFAGFDSVVEVLRFLFFEAFET